MRRDRLVALLDEEFRVASVRGDEWGDIFDLVYPEPYWREFAEPGYEGRWNGLTVAGSRDAVRAVTCVFPSDRIVAALEPGTLLFSEHPVDYADDSGFLPLARASFERLRDVGAGFYHVHAPIDHHPRMSPSRLCAGAAGVAVDEEFLPIAQAGSGPATSPPSSSPTARSRCVQDGRSVRACPAWRPGGRPRIAVPA